MKSELTPHHDDSVWAEAAREADHEALMEAMEFQPRPMCSYGDSEAETECAECGAPLCSCCGFITDTGHRLCNKHFAAMHSGGM